MNTVGSGGTFCQFTVGSPAPNASVRYLRYAANEASVRDREQGTLLWNLPERHGPQRSYAEMTHILAEFAKADAAWERAHHHSRGRARTHYCALLSFEAEKGNAVANGLVAQWLARVLPKARAASFLHRNTGHFHAHVWIAARQTDGKKINLDARAYRQLDETWNRLYCHAFDRLEQEHLAKKWQTEGYKHLRQQGRDVVLPERVSHGWKPEMFTQKERERLGAGQYERDESGVGSHQRGIANNDSRAAGREQNVPGRSGPVEYSADYLNAARRSAERALSEARGLHEAAARMAQRERKINHGLERERER